MNNAISQIVKKYKPGMELEIRIYINTDDFIHKINELMNDNSSITQSVSMIGNIRKESIYNNGKRSHVEYIRKTPIKNYINRGKFKIALSQEEMVKEQKIIPEIIRIKNRLSIIIDDWRHDFTIVKTVHKESYGQLKQIVTDAMKPITIDDFMDMIPSQVNSMNKVEYEVEFIGEELTVDKIHMIIMGNKYKSMLIGKIGKMINRRGETLKQLVNNPIQLNKNTYHSMIPIINEYYVSHKADGERALLYTMDETKLITNAEEIDLDTNINFKGILDCEVIGDMHNPDMILIFDVIYHKGSTTMLSLIDRIQIMNEISNLLPNKIYIKEHHKLTDYKNIIYQVYNDKALYPIDGLIFTHMNNYFSNTYKWKPTCELTIDFLVVKPNNKILSLEEYNSYNPKKLGFLYCGINIKMYKILGIKPIPCQDNIGSGGYFATHFSPSMNPMAYIIELDNIEEYYNHIVEFSYIDGKFTPKMIREDKDALYQKGSYFGNDFRIAELTYNSYINPLEYQDLISDPDNYFRLEKSDFYKPMIKFNSYVKQRILQQVNGYNHVLDLASGKGQDLFIYHANNVSEITMVDIDVDAIEQLNERKFKLGNPKFYPNKVNVKRLSSIKINTHIMDINNEPLLDISVNAVIINFAIHYFTMNEKATKRLLDMIDNVLCHNGLFIFTCFDGNKLKELLDYENMGPVGEICLYEEDKLKYHIRKKDDNKIEVFQPFMLDYMDEYIVDINFIIKYMEGKKYIPLHNNSFMDYINHYQNNRERFYNSMSINDKIYSGLYKYVTLYKS